MDAVRRRGDQIEWAVVVVLTAVAVILWAIDLVAFARMMGR